MNLAHVMTPWTGSGTPTDPHRPLLADSYSLISWEDATGQDHVIPSPNTFVAAIVCTDASLTTIQADANYAVLWSEAL